MKILGQVQILNNRARPLVPVTQINPYLPGSAAF